MALAIAAQPETPDDANHPLRFASWIPLPEPVQHALEKRFEPDRQLGGLRADRVRAGLRSARRPSPRKRETCGAAAPGLEVRIVDAEDARSRAVRSARSSCARWSRTACSPATGTTRPPPLEAFRNLWHHTGDTGRMDAEGFLTFVDRKKDAMRRRGENVSSLQVEAAIVKHPGIAEVAVHAVPSPATEDDIKACIVPAPGAELTAAELFEFFAETLPVLRGARATSNWSRRCRRTR